MSGSMKWVCALGLLAFGSVAPGHSRVVTPRASAPRSVVVAELFTSEGCSSCPPADDVLSQLAHRQLTPNVEVLTLGEHVDYWDRLGWRDSFSSALFSERQSNYERRVFHTNQLYTPQLVVDGQYEQVGSDITAVLHAIAQAAEAPKATVGVTVARDDGGRDWRVNVRADVPPTIILHEPVDVVVAVAEDNLVTNVRRGENGGRTLRHDAVVRYLMTAETKPLDERTWATHASVPWQPAWNPANVRVVALLQARDSRRIIGAGFATVGESTSTK